MVGVAGAVPMTWTDSEDWNPDHYVSWFSEYDFTLDISDDGFVGIFEGGDDIVFGYSLTVDIFDDGGRRDRGEIAYIDQPGIFGDGFYNFSYTSQTLGWSLAGIVSLNLNGELNVTVDSWYGDFYLDAASVTAWGDDGTAPVPEPSTILLMGVGLVGLVGVGRKRFVNKG